jgi:hypothetical protein
MRRIVLTKGTILFLFWKNEDFLCRYTALAALKNMPETKSSLAVIINIVEKCCQNIKNVYNTKLCNRILYIKFTIEKLVQKY